MANVLLCDGCGNPIQRGDDPAERYRVLLMGKPEGIFDISGMKEGHDFCSLGCLGSWAVTREVENAKR